MVHDTILICWLVWSSELIDTYIVDLNPRGMKIFLYRRKYNCFFNFISTVFFFVDVALSPNDRLSKRHVKCALPRMNDIQDLRSVSLSLLLSTHIHRHAHTEPDPKAIFGQGSRVCPHYCLWLCSHHSVTAPAARMGFPPLFFLLRLLHLFFTLTSLAYRFIYFSDRKSLSFGKDNFLLLWSLIHCRSVVFENPVF